MFKLKGLYEWKLIDKDTQEIVQKGEQWNVISDAFYKWMFVNSTRTDTSEAYPFGAYYCPMLILLSDTIPDPATDYRRAGRSNSFNIVDSGDWKGIDGSTTSLSLKTKYCDQYFTPPKSPRTIRVIGVKIGNYYVYATQKNGDFSYFRNFPSFIELSTPITQDSTQYLYVKYTIFCSYESVPGSCGVGSNDYHDLYMGQSLYTNNLLYMGAINRTPGVALTSFLPAVDINNVMRAVCPVYKFTKSHVYHPNSNVGSSLSAQYAVTLDTTTYAGPIGAVVFQQHSAHAVGSWDYYLSHIYCCPPSQVAVPSISRIFVHPGNRDGVIFRDSEPYPALSQGTISVTGTPTNKYTMIGRIRITKTGDASDLVDEIVPYTAVNAGANTITVTQDIATGDMYRLTTTGTLPSPLVAGTDYYIIRDNATTIRLATTYDFAIAGTAIDITDQGSGNHTLIRQNTGTYRLQLEPYKPTTYDAYFESSSSYSDTTLILRQLSMAIDFDGNVMPAVLSSGNDTPNNKADGDYHGKTSNFYSINDTFPGTDSMVRGTVQNGDYIYSAQLSRKGLINNICRWRFNTIETSQPLCKFGNGSTVTGSVVGTADYMYITTNDGIYRYAFATPTTAPELLTITGMIDNVIQDACIDPVTGYMWTGHTTGLSKIDLGTLTATQYIRGTGQALEGLAVADVNIAAGALDAYNGRILKGIAPFNSSTYGGVAINSSCWVMDDAATFGDVKWHMIGTACWGSCLRKGTTHVVYRGLTDIYLYDVITGGKGTGGTQTQIETFTSNYYMRLTMMVNIAQISDTRFMFVIQCHIVGQDDNQRYHTVGFYTIGAHHYHVALYRYHRGSEGYANMISRFGWAAGARRNLVNLDGNSYYGLIHQNWLITYPFANPVSYGWDGSAWVKDNPNSRNIPRTATHNLVSGLSINFNNATGALWDRQFILNESFNVCYGPQNIKDNLQVYNLNCKSYYCAAFVVEGYSANVGAAAPYVISIPEKSDPNFRDMDRISYVTEVIDDSTSTALTSFSPTYRTVTFTPATDIVNSGTGNIPTGTPVAFFAYSDGQTEGQVIVPLDKAATYYAINVSTTTIRLAATYEDAMAGTPYINLIGSNSGTQYLWVITPGVGEYFATLSGDFFFNSADAGKAMTLTYTYTKFST